MTSKKFAQIQEEISFQKSLAKKILEGEIDNYDGADGARHIMKICKMCEELLNDYGDPEICGYSQ